jgi:hypothetical protein
MKTVIISGGTPLPAELRDLVERGSTSLVEHRADELAGERVALDADRIVFWTASGDEHVLALADRYSQAEAAERREVLVFITPERNPIQPWSALPPNEFFVWPNDEDRLKMAFLTGA